MKISPSSSTVMLGQGSELVHLNCSVYANPLSRLKWTRIGANFTEPLEAYQPIVGFNETVFSILSVNVTKLGLGTHMFECRVDVTTFLYHYRLPRHHTASANVTVFNKLELFVTTADAYQKPLDPERITVGYTSDLALEIRCFSRSTAEDAAGSEHATAGGRAVSWEYGENGTTVESGLNWLGTSQSDGGVLRIYPLKRLSPWNNATYTFQCKHVNSGYAINVTLELRKQQCIQPTTLQLQCSSL